MQAQTLTPTRCCTPCAIAWGRKLINLAVTATRDVPENPKPAMSGRVGNATGPIAHTSCLDSPDSHSTGVTGA
jgi:hypothetical protein